MMTIMQFEFPTIVYAHELMNTTDPTKCNKVYEDFGFDAASQAILCKDPMFMSTESFGPYYNIMQVYLHQDKFNPMI